MDQLLEIDLRLIQLSEVKATERNASIIGERLDLIAKRNRLLFNTNLQASLLRVGHRSRF